MSPQGGAMPGKLEQKMVQDFGSVQAFKDQFKAAATSQFGSGWAWLVLGGDGKLSVSKTPNGSNPLAENAGRALIGIDVWEHSYYLDFRNRRPDYVTTGSTSWPITSSPRRRCSRRGAARPPCPALGRRDGPGPRGCRRQLDGGASYGCQAVARAWYFATSPAGRVFAMSSRCSTAKASAGPLSFAAAIEYQK